MFYVFTESKEGKFGYVGREYFSEVQAQDKADEYDCITHVIRAKDLGEAKRNLRTKAVKTTGDINKLYKNVRRRADESP